MTTSLPANVTILDLPTGTTITESEVCKAVQTTNGASVKFSAGALGPKTALVVALLLLSACTREEATASLKADVPVDEFEIIHARFPCRSPDMHFFGYRFRIRQKNEYAYGDICWDVSAREWMGNSVGASPIAPQYTQIVLMRAASAQAFSGAHAFTG
jgi:hypothetical protein